jgi:hypothetical protein
MRYLILAVALAAAACGNDRAPDPFGHDSQGAHEHQGDGRAAPAAVALKRGAVPGNEIV